MQDEQLEQAINLAMRNLAGKEEAHERISAGEAGLAEHGMKLEAAVKDLLVEQLAKFMTRDDVWPGIAHQIRMRAARSTKRPVEMTLDEMTLDEIAEKMDALERTRKNAVLSVKVLDGFVPALEGEDRVDYLRRLTKMIEDYRTAKEDM